jgi:hypothetical protein
MMWFADFWLGCLAVWLWLADGAEIHDDWE